MAASFLYHRAIRGTEGEVSLAFSWHGGPYIDLGITNPMTGEFIASEVINVWNYDTDTPRIAVNNQAFIAKVDEWIKEYPEDALVHDAIFNW